VFLKVDFILVKVRNPHEYVDIDIYAKFHVVFWFTCIYFKYNFGLLVVFFIKKYNYFREPPYTKSLSISSLWKIN
jgi:hypothetical protein